MKQIKLFSVLLLTVIMTSCFGDSNNTLTQDFSSYCTSYVVDTTTGTTAISNGATYKAKNNIDKGTMTLEVSGLKLPNGTYMAFTLEDQRYIYNEKGAIVINVPSAITVMGDMSHTITNLYFEYYSRYLGTQAFPMIVMNFTIDYQYTTRVIYNPAYYWGTTTITDQEGNVFTNSEQSSFYGVQFDIEKNKAIFGAFNAKFNANMPSMNMTFKDLDYTLSTTSYTVSKDEIIPTIGDTPYPSYKITDFHMTGTWGGNQYVSFTCTIYTEKLKGTYRVSASLAILPPNTSNN